MDSSTSCFPAKYPAIPQELRQRRQWVGWRLEQRPEQDEPTKVPINPHTGKKASSTNPATWGTYDEAGAAVEAYGLAGVGYVFAVDDPYCGIDLDKCIDPQSEEIAPWAVRIIEHLWSYTELSPSQTGVHIIAQGSLPGHKGRRKAGLGPTKTGKLELYDTARFFTMTGNRFGGTATIAERQAELTALYAEFFPPQAPQAAAPAAPSTLDDRAVLERMFAAANGAEIRRLWDGDTSGYPSHSEADLSLCSHLAFWTAGDTARMDALFRQSWLYREDKWNRADYRQGTITRALHDTGFYDPERQRQRPPAPKRQSALATAKRPTVQITTEMHEVVNAGLRAIVTMPRGPRLYQHTGRLCFISTRAKPPRGIDREAGTPVFVEAAPAKLRELAGEAAVWQKWDARAKKLVATYPPRWVAEHLLARGGDKDGWPDVPPLEGIITAPTFRPDGTLLDTPGYDPETGLYFTSNGLKFLPVPDQPTYDEVRSAVGALDEVFRDFPFEREYHRAACLAAILTLCARFAVEHVPLVAVSATTPASGKGLLVDAISLITTGRRPARMPQLLNEDEERKRLLSLALAGDRLVLIDNITRPLGNGALDLAITASVVRDRLLGKNEAIEAPWRAVLCATGNNLQYRTDMARRVLPIILDPQMERPEERDDFLHPHLLVWVRQQRPRLVQAALTILQGFIQAGKPGQGVKQIGSFEVWSDLIRQAVIWAGEPDPASGRAHVQAEADPEFENYMTLLEAWDACYGQQAHPLKTVLRDIMTLAEDVGPPNHWNDLREALGAFDRSHDGKRSLNAKILGHALRKWEGRVIGLRRIVRRTTEHRAGVWGIESIQAR